MMEIKGEIQKGLGQATTSLLKQISYLKEYIPDIDKYYKGTINLLLEKPLVIFSPDIKTKPIQWYPGLIEEFGFLKIKLETISEEHSEQVDALIYIPYKSPYYLNPFYKEILAPKVNLKDVKFCKIIIEKEAKEIAGIVI